jgi:hypothetical protein
LSRERQTWGDDNPRKGKKSLTNPTVSFSGRCPQCRGYDTRIRTEVINYNEAATPPGDERSVVSRTRIFFCNRCKNVWSETISG